MNFVSPFVVPNSYLDLDIENQTGRGIILEIQKSRRITKDKPNRHCTKSSTYSLTECWERKVIDSIGCKLPWDKLEIEKNIDIANCTTSKEYLAYETLVGDHGYSSADEFLATFQCPALCEVDFYDVKPFYLSKSFPMIDNRIVPNHVIVFFNYNSNEVNIVEEQISYDINNFTGEVGGSLGFFMGASVFTFFYFVKGLLTKKRGNKIIEA